MIGRWRIVDGELELGAQYLAIRTAAAAVDLTGQVLLEVGGEGALEALDALFSRDLTYLPYEASTTGLFLSENGIPLDVATIYRLPDVYLVETSVGHRDSTLAHLQTYAAPKASVVVSDRTLLLIEGPTCWSVLDELLAEPASGLPFQGLRSTMALEEPVLVSRTGYTGEFGAKLIAPPSLRADLWAALIKDATPITFDALEIAMLEVRQPAARREFSKDLTVGEAGYSWLIDFEKETYLGREAAIESLSNPPYETVCFVTDASDFGSGAQVRTQDREVGYIVTADTSPSISSTFGIARVLPEVAASGLVFGVDTPSGLHELRTVSSPIVVPTSWHALTLSE